MHGLISTPSPVAVKRQSARRHFDHGHRRAAVRALTAALLVSQSVQSPTLAAAAESTGSNVPLTSRPSIILVKAENPTLVSDVLAGQVLDPTGGGAGATGGRSRHRLPRSQGSGSGCVCPRLWSPRRVSFKRARHGE